jgi:hypothetical protein
LSIQERSQQSRAFRGLALVFVLVFINLFGIMLTLATIGGLEPWTTWQFLGLFGVVETAAGISNIFAPNIWHLPVAELNTSRRTRIHLAASAMLLPHWGGAARAVAGATLLLISGFHEGWEPESVLLIVLEVLLCVIFLGISAAAARPGVAHPDTDTMQFILRWRKKDRELEPISISASVQQFILGILTLPAVKVLEPGALFGPELRPSAELLGVSLVLAVLSIAATVLLWTGRLRWQAPREQQREAEQNA